MCKSQSTISLIRLILITFDTFDIFVCNTHASSQALSIAVQYGRVEAVLKLLQLGADKTIRTNTGKSPADLAVTYKHTQVPKGHLCFFVQFTHKKVFFYLSKKLSFKIFSIVTLVISTFAVLN